MKKYLAIILAAMMIFTLAPSVAMAAETGAESSVGETLSNEQNELNVLSSVVDSGSCGTNVKWSLSSKGVLTISGSGKMNNYNQEDAPWKCYSMNIKKVIIAKGVTSVGASAFSSLTSSFTEAEINEGVKKIGDNAFGDNPKLAVVNIPSSVTSIGQWAFFGCSSLKSLTIPSSVKTIGDWAFNTMNITLNVYSGSAGEKYAKENSIDYKIIKDANPMKFKASSTTLKYKTLKTKKLTYTITFKTKAQGTVTYTLSSAAKKAKITVSSKGKITVPKGCKKGTYVITVKAKGNAKYKAGKATFKVIVK